MYHEYDFCYFLAKTTRGLSMFTIITCNKKQESSYVLNNVLLIMYTSSKDS